MRGTTRAAVCGLSAAAFLLTGCGRDTLDPGGTQASTASSEPVVVKEDPALAAMVPANIKKLGTLTIGTDASYAPNEFTENGNQIKGMDIDLLTAVAQKLGLKLQFQNGNFDSLIGGVTAGKYPIAISSFTINKERMQQVSMIQYFNAGTAWAVAQGNPQKIDINDLCGKRVGLQKGTVQVDDAAARTKKCKQAGKPGLSTVIEDAQSKVTADLMAGKVDAMAADSPVTSWAVAQSQGKLEKTGQMYDAAPYGIVVPKSDDKLAEAISKALQSLKGDGSYQKVLKNWSNTDGAVSEFPVNPQVG